MKIYDIFLFVLIIILFGDNYVCAYNSLLENVKVFNIDVSDNYIVYEYEENINELALHYISYYDVKNKSIHKILSNNGEMINSDMFFPSISKDGKYIVYTSRADNVTEDIVNECVDILDGELKKCSNIYIYNVDLRKSTMVKYNDNAFNGDNYVAKISGNGNAIAFESVSSNLLSNNMDCGKISIFSKCINIYKYNILTKKTSLISTGKNRYGGDSNSITPSISDDGRYISFQSNSTNMIDGKQFPKNCVNYINFNVENCSNIFLVDTKDMSVKLVSKYNSIVFDNNSGNAKISGDGSYVIFESYATNIIQNGKSHIYKYNVDKEDIKLITKIGDKILNRDSFIGDISNDGKYIIFDSYATNLGSNNDATTYVYSTINNTIDKIEVDEANIKISKIKYRDLIYYDGNSIAITKIDSIPPKIKDNQVVYVLLNDTNYIKDKIEIIDNLSLRDRIDIYVDDAELFERVGEYNVCVTAVDEVNNVSHNMVKVVILLQDVDPPIFTEISEIKILKGSNTLNLSNYIKAEDKIDGITKIYITDDGNLDLNVGGKYFVKLMTQDNSNNISYKEIVVIVYESYNFQYFYELLIVLGILAVIIFSIIKVK